MRLDKPQTFPAMAVTIGWAKEGESDVLFAGRSLMRLCLRREDEISKEFVIRDRGGRPDKVTLSALLKYMPELRPARVEASADSLRRAIDELGRRQHDIATEEAQRVVAPVLARVAELESEVMRLAGVLSRRQRRRKRSRGGANLEPRGTTPNHV